MRFLTRHISVLTLLLFFAFPSLVAGQSTTSGAVQRGTVTGTVTIKGRPVTGVIVGVQEMQRSSSSKVFKSKTDQDGIYRVTDIPPGTYQVLVSVPAYVVSGKNDGVTTLVITSGETVNGIDFALVRGGVITGRVIDADGKPVVEERVMLRDADPTNQRVLYRSIDTITDDRGIYRMFGVPAGRYKVFIGRGADGFYPGGPRTLYTQTFHPDTSDPAKATIVEVTEGGEASDVNIAVGRATTTFAINGRVVDGETNTPVPRMHFGVQMPGDRGSLYQSRLSWSNARGEFRIDGLSPGKYGIFMVAPPESNLRADMVNVEIVDQDIDGVVIKTSKAATVSGTVVLENPDNNVARAKMTKVQLLFYVRSTDAARGFRMGRRATINPDGTFTVSGLESGLAYINLGNVDGSDVKGLAVARVVKDGIIQQRGLEIKTGETITDVQVIVSYGSGAVHGTIKLTKGTIAPNTRFWVQIVRLDNDGIQILPPEVDARGQFLIEGLSSGTYVFTIHTYDSSGKLVSRIKQQVNVADGSTSEIIFPIDPDAPPTPNQ